MLKSVLTATSIMFLAIVVIIMSRDTFKLYGVFAISIASLVVLVAFAIDIAFFRSVTHAMNKLAASDFPVWVNFGTGTSRLPPCLI